MVEKINMLELLAKIKQSRKHIENIKKDFLEGKNSKSLINLYNPSRNTTWSGMNTEDKAIDMAKSYDEITEAIGEYTFLQSVKEQINAISVLDFPLIDITGTEIQPRATVAQLLVAKSAPIREYYDLFIKKLHGDIEDVYIVLDKYNKSSMEDDKVRQYVTAKLNSLNLNSISESLQANYNEFAKEYILANEFKIFDPLNIKELSEVIQDKITKYYSDLDCKLTEFNVSTKIIIDTKNRKWSLADKSNEINVEK